MPAKPLRETLLERIQSKHYQRMRKSELARALTVPSGLRAAMRKDLEALVADGSVVLGGKARYKAAAKTGNRLIGTLKFHPKGHAFFFPDMTDPQNVATGLDLVALNRIHVNRRDAGTALDGDRVLVTLRLPKERRESRSIIPRDAAPDEPKGTVEKILVRRSGRIVGVFRQKHKFS